MPSSHVAGVRMPFSAAPACVRRWAEHQLGSSLVSATDVVGGMSPGPAARLQAVSGTRSFVKACGPALNPDTPGLLRDEVAVLNALPAHPNVPSLLATYDDGDWVALLLEDINAPLVELPWRQVQFDRVSHALVEVHEASTPNPWAAAPSAPEKSAPFLSRWRTLVAQPPVDLSPWWRAHLEPLAVHAAHVLDDIAGTTLSHWDVRADNLMVDDRRVVVVDWGQARLSAPWVDHALIAFDVAMSGGALSVPDAAASDPVLRQIDPAMLLSLAAAMAMAFELRWRQPPVIGLPTLGETSRRWSRAFEPVLDHLLVAVT
ncbi:MAG: hypothetical protein ABI112_09605 [Terracoccus sp.]